MAIVAVEGWFIAHLLRQSGRFLLAVDELRLGVPASPERARSSTKPVSWQVDHATQFALVAVSRGAAEINWTHATGHGIGQVYREVDRTVSAAFGVTGTPAAALLLAHGTIVSKVTAGATKIRSFVTRITACLVIILNNPAVHP